MSSLPSNESMHNMSKAAPGFCIYVSSFPQYITLERLYNTAHVVGTCLGVKEIAPGLVKVSMRWHEDATKLHSFLKRSVPTVVDPTSIAASDSKEGLLKVSESSNSQTTICARFDSFRIWHPVRVGGQRDIEGPSAMYVRIPLTVSVQNIIDILLNGARQKKISYVPYLRRVSLCVQKDQDSQECSNDIRKDPPQFLEARFDCCNSLDAVHSYDILYESCFPCTLGVLGSSSDSSSTDESDSSTWWDSSSESDASTDTPTSDDVLEDECPDFETSHQIKEDTLNTSKVMEPCILDHQVKRDSLDRLVKARRLFSNMQDSIPRLRQWNLECCINKGNNSVVYLASRSSARERSITLGAVKIMRRSSILYISRELECLYAAHQQRRLSQLKFHGLNETYGCIVLECLGIDVAELTFELRRRHTLTSEMSELFALLCLRGMLLALSDLHRLGYVHKSVKPENFCLQRLTDVEIDSFDSISLSDLVLIDFGRVERIKEPDTTTCDWRKFHGWWYNFAAIAGLRQYALDDVHSAIVSAISLKWSLVRKHESFTKKRKRFISSLQKVLSDEKEKLMLLHLQGNPNPSENIQAYSEIVQQCIQTGPVPPEHSKKYSREWSNELFASINAQRNSPALQDAPDYDALLYILNKYIRLSDPKTLKNVRKLNVALRDTLHKKQFTFDYAFKENAGADLKNETSQERSGRKRSATDAVDMNTSSKRQNEAG